MGRGAGISATTFRASATNGAQARISFFGTGVSWIGARAEFLGYAHVFLNRSYIGTVDQYGPATQLGQTLISVQGLPLGQHELHIMSSDQKNTNATSNWTVIDAFDVRR